MNGCEFVVVAVVASSAFFAVIVKCTVFLITIYDAFFSGLDHLYRCVDLDCLICIRSSHFRDRKEKGNKNEFSQEKLCTNSSTQVFPKPKVSVFFFRIVFRY